MPEELKVGDQVFFYRKPRNTKNWFWYGPSVVIGKEGSNLWLSYSGRCYLTAPEHIRKATGEELGAAFATRMSQDDLNKLLEYDPDDYSGFEDNLDVDPAPAMEEETEDIGMPLPEEEDQDHAPAESSGIRRGGDELHPPLSQEGRRMRRKTKPPVEEAMILRKAKTARGKEKQLEKELPWFMIPEDKKDDFRGAERLQWDEHVKFKALEPVSVEDSRKILATKRERVLNSRFAYKDKLWSRRKHDPEVGWKPKARLVIGGHMDPDLSTGLETNAPTVSRQGVLALLQILASRLQAGWCACAGDITSAFLNGEELQRELYIRQPKSGLGDLHPEQLVKLKKWVFGLADSPHQWWRKFRKSVTALDIVDNDGNNLTIRQCPLDPCIFMFQRVLQDDRGNSRLGSPEAYLAVHVDDVLLIGGATLVEIIKAALSNIFPITDWEKKHFEYIGSYVNVTASEVKISQSAYVETRLFQIDIPSHMKDDEPATEERCHDNRSLVGWLVRPGLIFRREFQCANSSRRNRAWEM